MADRIHLTGVRGQSQLRAAVTGIRGLFARLAGRLRQREDSEHEQAIIRAVFIGWMFIYMMLYPHAPDRADKIIHDSILVFATSGIVVVAIFLDIVFRPQKNVPRRLIGLAHDLIGGAAAMIVGGEAAMIFYPVLLWFILGHGIRYGIPYLFAAAFLSVLLFSVVIAVSPEWQSHPSLNVALILALIFLPTYTSFLLAKLQNAIARAEEANLAKSRFLATMSHEFRTPLNVIIGLSDMMRETRLDRDQKDMNATMRGAADSLLALVNNVLDLAKAEARQLKIDPVSFRLDRRLTAIRGLLMQQARAKGLYLRLRIDPKLPLGVIGGEQSLHQILTNLVANAVKFTTEGGVVIDVRQLNSASDHIRVRFDVHDTGIGISLQDQQHIFDRFTQSESTRHNQLGGTGLGLSITRELIELMGGEMGVVSSPGRGSTFWFELEFEQTRSSVFTSPFIPRTSNLLVLGSADDSPAVLRSLARHMGSIAYHSSIASLCGELETRPFPCAVITLGTDSLSGLERLVAEIENLELPEPVDVISLSANGTSRINLTLADLASDCPLDLLERSMSYAFSSGPIEEPANEATPSLLEARHPASILLVEDNITNQKVFARILEHAGHEITIVSSGDEALSIYRSHLFDIILMDLNMPGLGGFDTLKLLRFSEDAELLPPVVALTADATHETRRQALELGFSEYLTKPVEAQRLVAMVDRLARRTSGDAKASDTVRQRPRPAAGTPQAPGANATILPVPERLARGVVLDETKIRSLIALDHGDGFFREVVSDYLADAATLIESLETDASDGHAGQFRDHAHALKSASAHLGASLLFERCLGWRNLDDHALLMRARCELADLKTEYEAVREALGRRVESHQEDRKRQSGSA
ncbi:MAG: response regulator [Geminicoccaceae bacterium]|nr:response regulator [Geminicoccaceae bacterium]